MVGLVATAAGIAVTHPALTGYGVAILAGVAISRALTRASLARARAAGFEMVWKFPEAVARTARLGHIVLKAELRNRDTLPTHFRDLSVSHAPGLKISCHPTHGEVPAKGSLEVSLTVTGLRVGLHGLFNLTLQTIRAPGLYTVPLSFSNPFVIEVLPKTAHVSLRGAVGGRARSSSHISSKGKNRGDGTELREIRDHRPGEPYRRIAWKASARRGRLLVIEKEREQSDVTWVVVDCSVDSASGIVGKSPLDLAIDEAMSTIEAHLAQGDKVGLALVGSRILAKIPPGRGPRHAATLLSRLTLSTHTADADRSDWDEGDVARYAYEHAASLDARASEIKPFEYDKLAALVKDLQRRAPMQAEQPWASTKTDALFRRYLLSFGIQPPPRGTSDRHQSERRIAELLREIQAQRPRPSLIYLFLRVPTTETPAELLQTLAKIPGHRMKVRFCPLVETTSLLGEVKNAQQRIVFDAMTQRHKLMMQEGQRKLARMGIGTTARIRSIPRPP